MAHRQRMAWQSGIGGSGGDNLGGSGHPHQSSMAA